MTNIDPFQIPNALMELADDVQNFRVRFGTQLTVNQRRTLNTRENALRGVSVSLSALITHDAIDRITEPLAQLGEAIDEADEFLMAVESLRQALGTIARVLNLASSIITLMTPVTPVG
ncbi:MAG: hypothetical protein ACFB4I_17635 [Cyanophyceae cyanobacterium]